MPKGSVHAGAQIQTSLWIKEHLDEAGEDYVLNMFNQMKQHFKTLKPGKEYKIGNYQTFRTYIYVLNGLDLITLVRKEEVGKPSPRIYYALNQDNIDSPAWKNPFKARYGKPKKGGKKYAKTTNF